TGVQEHRTRAGASTSGVWTGPRCGAFRHENPGDPLTVEGSAEGARGLGDLFAGGRRTCGGDREGERCVRALISANPGNRVPRRALCVLAKAHRPWASTSVDAQGRCDATR